MRKTFEINVYKIEGLRDYFAPGWASDHQSFNGRSFNEPDPNIRPRIAGLSEIDFEDIMNEDDVKIQENLELEAIEEISEALHITNEEAEDIWLRQKEFGFRKRNG